MTIKTLYRFKRPDGGITVSTEEPNTVYETEYRIIADEGKLITQNGEDTYSVIDTDSTEGWYEIDEPKYPDDEIPPIDNP